ncbi:MAG: FliO/MopB family protein [Opitutae bacterium]|nr:FliO/MopB family protein [Opitutae bacterium]
MKFPGISLVLATFLLVSPAQHGEQEKDSVEGQSTTSNSSTTGLITRTSSIPFSSGSTDSRSQTGGINLSRHKRGIRDADNVGSTVKVYGINNDVSPPKANSQEPKYNIIIWIWSFVFLLVFLIILYFLNKKGFFGRFRATSTGRLKIKDQIMLGNRQFLVVVEYDDREVLVGVGPGFIRQVSDLSNSTNEPPRSFETVLSDNLDPIKEDEN